MFKYLAITLTLLHISTNIFANNYEDAWKALNKNDRKTALIDLQKAFNDPSTAVDAYVTYMYLLSFEGKENVAEDFMSKVYDKLKDPNPYVYAMWFNKDVLGTYGKKTDLQKKLLDKIFNDGKCNGSLQSAAHYVASWNYVASNNFSEALSETNKMAAIGPLWQLTGPFDNLSGSGFNKEYGPLKHPEPGAIFKSAANANISWFTPTEMNKDGWTFPYAHIRSNTAIIYAQTFINSPGNLNLLLNAGFNGGIKVWINDELIIANQKELITELDYLKSNVQLKKGYNRLLVQLSYTDNSSPNFIIRLTDSNYMPVKDLNYTPAYQTYSPVTSPVLSHASIRHFAEAFFENKIQSEPNNFINYILLCETYLRNSNTEQAREVMEKAISKFPDNPLLRLALMSCYLKEDNNTLLLQEIERMKDKDPDCILASKLNINQLMQQEKYQDAEDEIRKYDLNFNDAGDNEMLNTKVRLYSAEEKIDTLVSLIKKAYAKNPDDPDAVSLMFNVEMNVNKNSKAALGVYENYLKNNFNYSIFQKLQDQYKQQGLADKELELLNTISKNFAYNPDLLTDVSGYYYDQQNYTKAAEIGKQVLALAPYVSNYWQNLGFELSQQHNNQDAIDALKKAIYYNANNYKSREKLRELQNKPSVWKAFPEVDVDKLIKNNPDTIKDYDYYYLADEKFAVVYPEGACEEYYTYIIKIVNDKGIDDWKETNLSYNSNSSDLIIDKAETVKENGVKTPAEQNDNQLVFTGLEAGDVIVIKYKIQNYFQGRLAYDYWNKFIFNSFVPERLSRFCLLVAKGKKFDNITLNTNIKPTTSSYDDFTLYTWQMENSAALEDEAFMPPVADVGASVTISTVNSWGDIASWYSDLSQGKTNNDFEVKHAFNQLFPRGTDGMPQKTIAETIYNYIEKNIRYSSVSFRQSSFTPQKPSVTINTGLGDCKDLSTLFVALSRMAGIQSNLVLVNTRDYGQKSMLLPSVEFNHCIAHAQLDNKEYYLELTDNTLPFASLPSDLYEASSLFIPANSKDTAGLTLQYIMAVNRTQDRIIRNAEVKVDSNDINVTANIIKTGALTSGIRDKYASLSSKQQMENLEKSISSLYNNQVKVTALSFQNLDSVTNTISYKCNYTIQDAIAELGDMKVIKIPFEEVIATVNNFSSNERNFPVEYSRYEDVDAYETTIEITIPNGSEFIQLPKDQNLSFAGCSYSLQYLKKDNTHLIITRKADLKKDNVAASDYMSMKNFLSNIIKAETKYIAYKQP